MCSCAADAPRGLCGAPRPRRGRGGGMRAAGRVEGYTPPRDRASGFSCDADPVSSRSMCIRVVMGRPLRHDGVLYEEARSPAVDREVHARRPAHGNGGRQSRDAGRSDGCGQPASAPAGLLQSLDVLAEPSSVVVLLSGTFIGPTSQSPRSTKRATTGSTSSKSRSSKCGARTGRSDVHAVARRPALRHLLPTSRA